MHTERLPRWFLRLLAGALMGTGLLAGCAPEPPPKVSGDKVYKYDGSVQCGVAPGMSVEAMAQQLTNAGIDVLCGQKGHDGNFYCAACGCGTGDINVYTIRPENLPDAESLGFAPVTDLPGYVDEPC